MKIFYSLMQNVYDRDTNENSVVLPEELYEYGMTVDVVPKQHGDGKLLHFTHL
jgi:hypothetical protein